MELPGNTRDEVSESDTEKVLILNRVSINVKGKKMDRVTEYVGLCKFVSLPKEIYTWWGFSQGIVHWHINNPVR